LKTDAAIGVLWWLARLAILPVEFPMLSSFRSHTLAIASALAVSAATSAAAQPAESAMFPLLLERSADLRFVAVETQRYGIVFQRTEDGWVASDRGGYPVTQAPISDLVATLTAFTAAQLVTDNPADHAALDVAGPGPETEDIRVTATTADGEVLADAFIGIPGSTTGPPRLSAVHVRRADENEVWMAAGVITLPSLLAQWFEPIARVPGPDVARISVLSGDTLLLTVEKDDFDAGTYAITYIDPELGEADAAVPDVANVRALAGAIVTIAPEDVRPRDAVTVTDDARTLRFETVDGLSVDLTVATASDVPWLLISASGEGGEAATVAAGINSVTENWAVMLAGPVTGRLTAELEAFYRIVRPADGFSVPY
jgi:hypothetical protein